MIYTLLKKIKSKISSDTKVSKPESVPTQPTVPTQPSVPKLSVPKLSVKEEPKMEFILSEKDFNNLYPRAKAGTYKALCDNLEKNSINTPKRIASFIAQCAHESGGFRVTSENLNYSEKALNTVFSKYFIRAGRDAAPYARNPERIANVVYAGRMGNNYSGDGWKFRGRGFIQLTGKNNYAKFQKDYDINVLDNPDSVAEDMNLSVLTAIWYWNSNNLNRFADSGDVRGLTKAINGGFNGLDDRIAQTNKLHALFGLHLV